MKSKTIKQTLKGKLNSWIDSIEDKEVQRAAKNSAFVSGGSIANMLLGEKVNDYDIYFTNKEDAEKIANYYCSKIEDVTVGFPEGFKAQSEHSVDETERVYLNVLEGAKTLTGEDSDGSFNYYPIFISNNAITLKGEIQLVFRFIGDPDTVHKNYDFVHCTNYWVYSDNKLVLRNEALECLLTKELRYIGSKYPICSIIRTRKFLNRGFTCNAGEYVKMCWQVSNLDLTDVNVLREQLVGVDIMYFDLVLSALEKKEKNDENFTINESYLFSLLDKVFN